jgi:chromosomal replication initiation ATPase DnaA
MQRDYVMEEVLKRVDDCRREVEVILDKPVKLELKIESTVSPPEIISLLKATICETFNVTWEQISSKDRKTEIKLARHFFCHFTKTLLGLGCAAVGRLINKDHTTVLNAWAVIRNDLSTHEAKTVRYHKILLEKLSVVLN